jgi:hypothetical protein
MSSWRPLVAGTVGVFLIVLAFLAGQLKSGGDPGLRSNAAAATSQPAPQDGFGAGPSVPYGTDPYAAPNGSSDGIAPPATHQS